MTLGIIQIMWALWFAFKCGSYSAEENKSASAYWGMVSIACAIFGIIILGGTV